MEFHETEYGFEWGPAKVERLFSGKTGWITIGIDTNRYMFQVYVTKTGKVRIHGRKLKGKDRMFHEYFPQED